MRRIMSTTQLLRPFEGPLQMTKKALKKREKKPKKKNKKQKRVKNLETFL